MFLRWARAAGPRGGELGWGRGRRVVRAGKEKEGWARWGIGAQEWFRVENLFLIF
jgi:hypothetical protein